MYNLVNFKSKDPIVIPDPRAQGESTNRLSYPRMAGATKAPEPRFEDREFIRMRRSVDLQTQGNHESSGMCGPTR